MEIGGADTDKYSHRTRYITGRHQLYVEIKPRPSGRGFNCVEGTSARKNSNKIWSFTRLIVPLTSSIELSVIRFAVFDSMCKFCTYCLLAELFPFWK